MKTGILLSLGLLFATLPQAHAAGPSNGVCPRYAAGSALVEPKDLFSVSGILRVPFNYETRVDDDGNTLYCFMTPDGTQSPTLHVHPGDELDRGAIAEAARVALARLRFSQLAVGDHLRVLVPLGPFAAGAIIEVVTESHDPRDAYRTVEFRGPGGSYMLSEEAIAHTTIIAAIYTYLART